MDIAGPPPAGRTRTDWLWQFQTEHHHRHAAPRGIDPAEDWYHEQQKIKQPMQDARALYLPGRHAVERHRFSMKHTPGKANDRNNDDHYPECEMQAYECGDGCVAADMRHCPCKNELRDEQRHDEPVQRFCGGGIAGRVSHGFSRLVLEQTAPICVPAVMSSREAPSSSGHEYALGDAGCTRACLSWSSFF